MDWEKWNIHDKGCANLSDQLCSNLSRTFHYLIYHLHKSCTSSPAVSFFKFREDSEDSVTVETSNEEEVGIDHLFLLFDFKARLLKLCLCAAVASVWGRFRLIRPFLRKLDIGWKLQGVEVYVGGQATALHIAGLEPFVDQGQ
jgi:hypothetical protein